MEMSQAPIEVAGPEEPLKELGTRCFGDCIMNSTNMLFRGSTHM